MIDVIGTDAGAPGTLPPAGQLLVQQAQLVAAPKRMLSALQQWPGVPAKLRLIASDDPIALSEALLALEPDQSAVVLASGDPLWFGIGRILIERVGRSRLRFQLLPAASPALSVCVVCIISRYSTHGRTDLYLSSPGHHVSNFFKHVSSC